MIRSIELNNFKAFKKSGRVDLKKINILVGPNSSGKSSFIKALLMLKNSIDSNEESVLGLDKEIGTYRSIVFNNDITNRVGFYIDFENQSTFTREDFRSIALRMIMFKITHRDTQDVVDHFDVEGILESLMERSSEFIVDNIHLEFNVDEKDHVFVECFHINFTNGDWVDIVKEGPSYHIRHNKRYISVPDIIKPYKFYFRIDEDKLHQLEDELEMMAILEFILKDMENRFLKFTNRMIYIEPLRDRMDRVEYIANLKSMNSVGSRGENILTTLLGIARTDGGKTMERINYWVEDFDLGEGVKVEKLGGDHYSVLIKNKYTGVYNNIMDVGVGTSQLLPIIIESVNSPDGSTLIIEEPETHIHPNAQSHLADLFVDCAKKQDKKFIIETHSIFLITQLQILVAKGEIPPEDIRVYYFLQDQEGSKVMDMRLTERGQFEEEWPSGFFDIHYELGKKLFKYL